MEAKQSLNIIKKLKPTNEDIELKDKNSQQLYKMISSMYQKKYNLKIDKKITNNK